MRIPYGFTLTSSGTLEINRSEANVVRMIFDFYMAGASLPLRYNNDKRKKP